MRGGVKKCNNKPGKQSQSHVQVKKDLTERKPDTLTRDDSRQRQHETLGEQRS